MVKTVNVPVGLGNPDKPEDPPVYLEPGDDVPSWAEAHIKPEYLSEDHPVAAGSDLYADPIYQAAVDALRELGVEPQPGLSSEQLAALVRAKLAGDEVEVTLDERDLDHEDYVPVDEQVDTMSKLFGEANASGNPNAPDGDEAAPAPAPKSTAKSTAKPGTTGGPVS